VASLIAETAESWGIGRRRLDPHVDAHHCLCLARSLDRYRLVPAPISLSSAFVLDHMPQPSRCPLASRSTPRRSDVNAHHRLSPPPASFPRPDSFHHLCFRPHATAPSTPTFLVLDPATRQPRRPLAHQRASPQPRGHTRALAPTRWATSSRFVPSRFGFVPRLISLSTSFDPFVCLDTSKLAYRLDH